MQFKHTVLAAILATFTFAAPAEEAISDVAERAAPCTAGYRVVNGKCFRTYCNARIFPSEADEVITSVSCTNIQQGVRKCAKDPDCDYVNFDSRTQKCVFIAEEGEGFGVQNGVARYNAGALVDDFACQ